MSHLKNPTIQLMFLYVISTAAVRPQFQRYWQWAVLFPLCFKKLQPSWAPPLLILNLNTAWREPCSLMPWAKEKMFPSSLINFTAFSPSFRRLSGFKRLGGTSHRFCIHFINSFGNEKDLYACTYRHPGEFWQKVGWARKYRQLKNKPKNWLFAIPPIPERSALFLPV